MFYVHFYSAFQENHRRLKTKHLSYFPSQYSECILGSVNGVGVKRLSNLNLQKNRINNSTFAAELFLLFRRS